MDSISFFCAANVTYGKSLVCTLATCETVQGWFRRPALIIGENNAQAPESLSDQAKDVVMGEPFGQDKKKSDAGERDLHSLRPQPLTCNRLLPPLSRGPVPQRPDSPDHVQVDAGPENSERHHGNAYGILVQAGCRRLGSRGNSRERSKSDDQAEAAERHHECAGALQDDKEKARQTDSPSADAQFPKMLVCLGSRRRNHWLFSTHASLTLEARPGYRMNSRIQKEGHACTYSSIPLSLSRSLALRKAAAMHEAANVVTPALAAARASSWIGSESSNAVEAGGLRKTLDVA
jgi:hypothetical protein